MSGSGCVKREDDSQKTLIKKTTFYGNICIATVSRKRLKGKKEEKKKNFTNGYE